jgi:hypothetical protein
MFEPERRALVWKTECHFSRRSSGSDKHCTLGRLTPKTLLIGYVSMIGMSAHRHPLPTRRQKGTIMLFKGSSQLDNENEVLT